MASFSSISGFGGGSVADFSAIRSKMFQKADTSGDNALSLEEFTAAGQNMPMGKIGMDADKAKGLFDTIDGNGDGSLSKDELTSFGDRKAQEMQSVLLQLQALMGQGARGANGQADSAKAFDKMDTNKDGTVSAAEFRAGQKQDPLSELLGTGRHDDRASDVFKAIDSNSDGSASKEEFTSFADAVTSKLADLSSSGTTGAASSSPLDLLTQALNTYRNAKSDLAAILLKSVSPDRSTTTAVTDTSA